MNKYQSDALSSFLPFWHFENDLMVYSDGSFGAGYELTGKDISCETDENLNFLSLKLENLINTADEGLKFQLFYKLDPNVLQKINKHNNLSKDLNKNYQEIALSRVNHLKHFEQEKQLFQPKLNFYVRGKPYKYKKKKVFEKTTKFNQISLEEFLSHKSSFLRSLNQVESSLNAIGFSPLRISKEKWFQEIFTFLNLSRSEKLGCPNLKENIDVYRSTE